MTRPSAAGIAEATNVIIALVDILENEGDRYWMTIFQKLVRGIYPFFYLNFLELVFSFKCICEKPGFLK